MRRCLAIAVLVAALAGVFASALAGGPPDQSALFADDPPAGVEHPDVDAGDDPPPPDCPPDLPPGGPLEPPTGGGRDDEGNSGMTCC